MSNIERFTDRVDDYAKHRPRYPEALADFLRDYGLKPGAVVLDAGSGTGLFSELLLSRGATVYGVEPNEEMRQEAVGRLHANEHFISLPKSAESSGMPGASVDLITAAQAFHWFDLDKTKREWSRILRPGGWVALIWNERDDSGPLAAGYGWLANAFVSKDQAVRRLANPNAQIEAFFHPNLVQRYSFPNAQKLSRDGLIGRALSSSYWPKEGPDYEASIQLLNELFDQHAKDGKVEFPYTTELFLGQL